MFAHAQQMRQALMAYARKVCRHLRSRSILHCLVIEPGNSGCSQDAQCTAAWPQTTCTNGACNCPTNYFNARTRDGNVCVATASSGVLSVRERLENFTHFSSRLQQLSTAELHWRQDNCIPNVARLERIHQHHSRARHSALPRQSGQLHRTRTVH